MERIRFQLFGVRPDMAFQSLVVDLVKQVGEIKNLVKDQFHLNPLLPISLIYQGKVLPDNDQLACAGISPENRIGVMILMTGG